ncbi:MAG: hypothetical protein WAT35_04795 [Tabrizicola sp.]|jgi:hypothetical protein|uniref:phage head-tail joining protein n=1 Tax=Tabrizicola sp. TaxID=2005166 RepID=UPI003BB18D41
MDTLSENQRRLDALRALRAEGIKSLRDSNGEEIVYKSDRELAAAISSLEAHIERSQRGRSSQIRLQTSKGIL